MAAPTVTITPPAGPPGTELTITGSGLPQGPVTIFLDEAGRYPATERSATVGAGGTLTVGPITVPLAATPGGHALVVRGAAGLQLVAAFTVARPELTVTPDRGPVGTALTVTGRGFVPQEPVELSLGGVGSPAPVTVVAQADGTLLSTALPNTATHLGWHAVVAHGAVGSTEYGLRTPATFLVTAPVVSVTSSQVAPGGQVRVTGRGFTPSEDVDVSLDGIDLGGGAVTAQVRATATGDLPTTTLAVPATTPPGGHPLRAIGHSGSTQPQVATLSVAVPRSTLTVSPTTGPANTTVTLRGTGFADGEDVGLELFNPDTLLGTVVATAGGFQRSVAIPAGTLPGVHFVMARTQRAPGGEPVAVFEVTRPASTAPRIRVEPKIPRTDPADRTLLGGAWARVKGSGFPANQKVDIDSPGSSGMIPSMTASATGIFEAEFLVVADDEPATYAVTARGPGGASDTVCFSRAAPRVSLDVTEAPGGADLAVNGRDFPPQEPVSLSAVPGPSASTTPNDDGRFSPTPTLRLPLGQDPTATLVRAVRVQTGTEQFVAVTRQSSRFEPRETTPTMRPSFQGSGFRPTAQATIRTPFAPGPSTIPVNADGSFTASVSLDSGHDDETADVTASVDGSIERTVMVSRSRPTLDLLPPSGGTGTTVTVQGNGFGSGERVTIHTQTSPDVVATATGEGRLTATFTVTSGSAIVLDVYAVGDRGTQVGASFARTSIATTTTLAATPTTAVVGQAVTLTATVSQPAGGSPTGTVTFRNGAAVIGTAAVDATGQAVLWTAGLAVGAHPLSATYGGDTTFEPSTSPAQTVTVSRANTTTRLAPSANPAAVGQPVSLIATVAESTAAVPTGTVQFRDGSAVLATVRLDSAGQAVLWTSSLVLGPHSLSAVYSGDTGFNRSSSPTTILTVNKTATTITLTATPRPAVVRQAVTLTAQIAAASTTVPSGTVTFLDGTTPLGAAAVDSAGRATLWTSALSAGSHSLTASYSGDGAFSGSSSAAVTLTVNKAATTTTLAANPSSVAARRAVLLTADVTESTAGIATGTVTFKDGATALGTVRLDTSARAVLWTSSLAVGSHAITATYGGDTAFSPSTSPAQTVTVT